MKTHNDVWRFIYSDIIMCDDTIILCWFILIFKCCKEYCNVLHNYQDKSCLVVLMTMLMLQVLIF